VNHVPPEGPDPITSFSGNSTLVWVQLIMKAIMNIVMIIFLILNIFNLLNSF